MLFGDLMEIIIYVTDMQKQVEFYRDVLEFEVSYPPNTDDYSEQMWVTFDTGACTLALHGGGAQRFGADAPKLVFQVVDMDAARVHLKDHDVQIGEIREAAPGVMVCDIEDPEGNNLSIEHHA